jgi:hypothetical protein
LLAFQQCMSLIAKIFLLFSSSSFFRFHFSCRVRANTQKCLETSCFGAHITHNNNGEKGDIYLPFSSENIKFNFPFLGALFARKFSHNEKSLQWI